MATLHAAPEHSPAPTPGRAVYGFCLCVLAGACAALYLVWVLVPPAWLAVIGVDYWPQQLWALTLPAALVTSVLMIVLLIYPLMGLLNAPGLQEARIFQDQYSLPPAETAAGAIPAVCDLSLTDVCQRLYLRPQSDGR